MIEQEVQASPDNRTSLPTDCREAGIYLPRQVILNHILTNSQFAFYLATVESFADTSALDLLPMETIGPMEFFILRSSQHECFS